MSLKIKTTFKTLSPFYTGSDKKQGNLMSILKDTVIDYSGKKIITKFKSEECVNNAVLTTLYPLFRAMDNDFKQGVNAYGGYNLFFAFVRKSLSMSNSWISFQSQIFDLIDSDNVYFDYRNEFKKIQKTLEFEHFKMIFTKNQKYLNVMLVDAVQTNNVSIENWKKANNDKIDGYEDAFNYFPYEVLQNGYSLGFEKTEIPIIAANGIRGKLRRLIFDAFLDLLNVKKDNLANQLIYEVLIQGGRNLHKPASKLISEIKGTVSDFYLNSEGILNMKNRMTFLENIPFLMLFGCSFGNQTVEGSLGVTNAKLRCKENGTGDMQASDFLNIIFHTHRDETAKVKHEFKEIAEGSAQMKFDIETVVTNSFFENSFSINIPKNKTELEEIEESCFYWCLKLLQENAKLGGRTKQGEGEMKITYDQGITGKEKLFVDYITKKQEEIRTYLQIACE